MVVQYTAAALVAELRALAHPVSVDSIPTSDNQEDHVSMGMTAALMALEAADRLEQVVAIELLCACQALDCDPGTPGEPVRRAARRGAGAGRAADARPPARRRPRGGAAADRRGHGRGDRWPPLATDRLRARARY